MPKQAEDFITLRNLGSHGFDGSCLPKRNVKPDNDTNSPYYNGIADYTTFTFEEAMKIYWLMKEITVTGSASFSASSSISGSYQRIIRVRDNPGEQPPKYSLETADSWSTQATAGSISDSTTMTLDNLGRFQERNARDPTPPQERICSSWDRTDRIYKMAGMDESSNSGRMPSSTSSENISASTGGSFGALYFYSHGYDPDGDNGFGRGVAPQYGPIRFYNGDIEDENNFVGYGFDNHFGQGEGVLYVDCRVRPPSFVPVYVGGEYIASAGAYMGGIFSLGNIAYSYEIGQWAGTGQWSRVSFGGVEMMANSYGSEYVNISNSGGGVKFSFSDSGTLTPSFNYDDRNQYGAGKTFNGSANGAFSGSVEIVIKDPTYWEY
tara:strand:+ start:2511 stop:3647 length:1137 start_codon:yes stop_codon:yes gene_type:complete